MHPALLAGLVAAALPVVIHLIGRRRAPQLRFAAFDFLRVINERLAKRERLRQFLLLLLRTLAVIAIVFAVARPVPSRTVATSNAQRRVALVVDASASMAYEDDGTPLLSRAKDFVRSTLASLQPGDAVALAIAGPDVRAPFEVPNTDLAAVRRAVEQVDEATGFADLGPAIDVALGQLGEEAGGAELIIVSDLSSNSFSALRPAGAVLSEVKLLDAAGRSQPVPLANLGIERVEVKRSAESPSERIVSVTVRNFGGKEVQRRPLELRIGDQVKQKSYVTVGPRAAEEKTLTVRFDGTGVYSCEIRLAPSSEDGYAADDSYRFATELNAGAGVLVVNGDPRTVPYEDELFFLERALQTIPRNEAPISLTFLTRDEILDPDANFDFTQFKAIVLANVGEFPEAVAKRLAAAVDGGVGLIFTLGKNIDFEKANRSYGKLLPHPLRDLFKAQDEVSGSPPLGIGEIDRDHPIFRGMDQAFQEGLVGSRTASYFNIDVGAERTTRALLRFENGAPALLESTRPGGGRVLMLTTSVDIDMSDLALRSSYPALAQRLVRYAAGALDAGGAPPTRVRETARIPLPTGVTDLALISPSGKRSEFKLDGAQRVLESGALSEIGFYAVELRRGQGDFEAEPRLSVAVNANLGESDFEPIEADVVASALEGDAEERELLVSVGASSDDDPFQQRGPATYLLFVFAALFAVESLLASRG